MFLVILIDKLLDTKMEVDILANMSCFIEGVKRAFSLKRTKVTLYIVAVLWLSVVTQLVMNNILFEDFEIAEAFVKANTEDVECNLEIVAQHHMEFLTESDKKDIIRHLANSIGLKMDSDITINQENQHIEYIYHKQAKKADTMIKVVSLEEEEDKEVKMKHFIIVRLNINESINSVEKYRKLIEKSLDGLGIENRQVNVVYKGFAMGSMSREDKEDMARLLVKELQGEEAFHYEQGEDYTVYAYTGLIDEYIETVGYKVNIQIAMIYDEQTERTEIYLASPIINQGW